METLSTYQNPIFLYSCVLGIILGFYYDIFKISRLVSPFTQKQLLFCDLFFMSTSAILTFIFLLALNSGQIRMYLLVGELIGFIIYKLTLSRIIIFCAKYVIHTIKRILSFIRRKLLSPIFSLILKILRFFKSKIAEISFTLNLKLKPVFKPFKGIASKSIKVHTSSKRRKNNKRKFIKPLKP